MVEKDNESKELIGKILRIDVSELSLPLYGRLLEVINTGLSLSARAARTE